MYTGSLNTNDHNEEFQLYDVILFHVPKTAVKTQGCGEWEGGGITSFVMFLGYCPRQTANKSGLP